MTLDYSYTLTLLIFRYESESKENERTILTAVADVSSSLSRWKGEVRGTDQAAELGSLSSDGTMSHHANVATIRRDLPQLLPNTRLLIGLLSGPGNVDRRKEVSMHMYLFVREKAQKKNSIMCVMSFRRP